VRPSSFLSRLRLSLPQSVLFLSLFLICLSVTFSRVSPSSATVFLCLAPTFSFSRRAANRAQTSLTVAVANAAAQRSAALHVVAFVRNFYAPLLSSYLSPSLVFSRSLSLSLSMHTASHEQLSTSPRTRLLPCAHYVINTFTSLALSDAISRRSSARVRVPTHRHRS